jgi:hypothetical protein
MHILNYGDCKYEALKFYNTNVIKLKLHSLSESERPQSQLNV